MKRGVIVLAGLLLVLIPAVFATISVEGPSKDQYNLGDRITLKGNILETEDALAKYQVSLNCGNMSMPWIVKTVNLESGQPYPFSDEVTLTTLTGSCVFVVELFGLEGSFYDQGTTIDFGITKDLDGSFYVEENKIQLGKGLRITGNVYKLDHTSIDGYAIVYLKRDGEIHFIDTASIKEGVFEYEHSTVDNAPGIYNVELLVTDIYGNQDMFTNISRFDLISEIYVFARTEETNKKPGQTIHLTGESKTILQEHVGEAEITITSFNGSEYKTNLVEGKFSYDIKIPEDIKTGKQIISVEVRDALGNTGTTDVAVYIGPIVKDLDFEIEQDTVKPLGELVITPLLYDQASDLTYGNITIELVGPYGDVALEDAISGKSGIIIPQYSPPGRWICRVSYKDLSKERAFTVEEVSDLSVEIENQTVIVKNTGNTDFNDEVEIDAGKYTYSRRKKLDPEEETEIELGNQFPTGDYDLKVNYLGKEVEFDDVEIIGKERKPIDTIYWLLLGALVLIIISILIMRTHKKRRRRDIWEREKKIGQNMMEKLRASRPAKKRGAFALTDSRSREEKIRDFRERILKDIKSSEEQPKKEGFKFKNPFDEKNDKGGFQTY